MSYPRESGAGEVPFPQSTDAERRSDSFDFALVARSAMAAPNLVSAENTETVNQVLGDTIGLDLATLAEFARQAIDFRRQNHDLRKQNQGLTEERKFDDITGALSRQGARHGLFDTAIHSVLREEPMYVLYSDLDDFKVVNDTFGHKAGDIYLQAYYRALRRFFTHRTQIARLHGDEFMITDTLHGHRRRTDNTVSHELHTIMGALDTFIPGEICHDEELRDIVDFDELRKLGVKNPGSTSVGGIVASADSVLQICQDVESGRLDIEDVAVRAEELSDKHMYVDKDRRRRGHQRDLGIDLEISYEEFNEGLN